VSDNDSPFNKRVYERFAQLVQEGRRIVYQNDGKAIRNHAQYFAWLTKCHTIFQQVFGEEHPFSLAWNGAEHSVTLYSAQQALAYVEGAYDEARYGFVDGLTGMIVGEVFADFLELAEFYASQRQKDSAAMVAGAVLEQGLKRLCEQKKIKVESSNDLAAVNQKLYQAKVYSKLVYQQIHGYNTLRNHAAHGEFDEYDDSQVKLMVMGVRDILAANQ